MKKLVKIAVLIAGIAIISASSLFAQKSGVFKTFADFTIGKMEYSIDCATEKTQNQAQRISWQGFYYGCT